MSILDRIRSLPEHASAREVALAMNVSGETVRRWARDGLLPRPIRLGPRKQLFSRELLLAHVESLASGSVGAA